MRMAIALGLVAASCLPAAGQARFDAASAARTVAPFIDEQTFLVARLDVARLDVRAIFAKARQFLSPVRSDRQLGPMMEKRLAAAERLVAAWVAGFRRAGGKDVYLVVSLTDLPRSPVFAVVPLHGRAEPGTMIRFLRSLSANRPASAPAKTPPLPLQIEEVVQMGRAVVVGQKHHLARLAENKPTPRPEIAQAFAAAGDGAVQIALIPTLDAPKVIQDMMPTLPEELGGGSSTAITKGLLWAALGVKTPPGMSLRVVIQSQDAASARALRGVLEKVVALVLEQADKDRPPPGLMDALRANLPRLLPAVQGDRLVQALGESVIDEMVADVLTPALAAARGAALRSVIMGNAAAILRGVHMYYSDHKTWPEDLDALVKAGLVRPKALKTWRKEPAGKVPFVYIKPPVPLEKLDRPGERLILHETFDRWTGEVAVGFADGHVEFIRDRARLERLLQAARACPPRR